MLEEPFHSGEVVTFRLGAAVERRAVVSIAQIGNRPFEIPFDGVRGKLLKCVLRKHLTALCGQEQVTSPILRNPEACDGDDFVGDLIAQVLEMSAGTNDHAFALVSISQHRRHVLDEKHTRLEHLGSANHP